MILIWRLGGLPELAHLTKAERAALLTREVSWRWYAWLIGHSLAIGFLATLILMWAIGVAVLYTRGSNHTAAPSIEQLAMVVMPTGTVGIGLAWYQIQMWRVRAKMRLEIRELLAGRRLPICFDCGYNLVGQAGERCPECGAKIIVPAAD